MAAILVKQLEGYTVIRCQDQAAVINGAEQVFRVH